jgi:hypothetical protein
MGANRPGLQLFRFRADRPHLYRDTGHCNIDLGQDQPPIHRDGETNDITHVKMQITLPYRFSDNTPATNPGKDLAVVNFPANCTSHPAWVYTEATFDNVRVVQ